MKCNLCISIGIGIIISALLMALSYSIRIDYMVEQEARKLGMIYPSEEKVLEK
jgi:hypothetical protein